MCANLKKFIPNGKDKTVDVQTSIEAFRCSSCNQPVAIQSGEEQKCSACGKNNSLPDNYKKLRDNKIKFDNTVKSQRELYERISREPGWFLRIWTGISDTLIATFGIIIFLLSLITSLGGLVLIAMVYLLVHNLAPSLGVNLNDVYGAPLIYFVFCIILSILILLPMMLNWYFQDIVTLRKIVQSSLSIKFPNNNPGAGNCRSCGSPLDFKESDICVCCPYCETENLTAVSGEKLGKLKEFSVWHFKKASDAEKEERKYLKRSISNFYDWIWITLVLAVLAAGLGFIFSWAEEGPKTSWSELQKNKNYLVPAKYDFDSLSYEKLELGKVLKLNKLAAYYWIALDKNEKIKITVNSPDYFPLSVFKNTTDFEGAMIREAFEWKEVNGKFSVEFTAPYKGKFGITTSKDVVGKRLQEEIEVLIERE